MLLYPVGSSDIVGDVSSLFNFFSQQCIVDFGIPNIFSAVRRLFPSLMKAITCSCCCFVYVPYDFGAFSGASKLVGDFVKSLFDGDLLASLFGLKNAGSGGFNNFVSKPVITLVSVLLKNLVSVLIGDTKAVSLVLINDGGSHKVFGLLLGNSTGILISFIKLSLCFLFYFFFTSMLT